MKNWHLIEQQPLLSEIYKNPPLISHKKGRSLKDILVRAKLWKRLFWTCTGESCRPVNPILQKYVLFLACNRQVGCSWIVKDPHFSLAHHRDSSSSWSMVRASNWITMGSNSTWGSDFFRASIWCKKGRDFKKNTMFLRWIIRVNISVWISAKLHWHKFSTQLKILPWLKAIITAKGRMKA